MMFSGVEDDRTLSNLGELQVVLNFPNFLFRGSTLQYAIRVASCYCGCMRGMVRKKEQCSKVKAKGG